MRFTRVAYEFFKLQSFTERKTLQTCVSVNYSADGWQIILEAVLSLRLAHFLKWLAPVSNMKVAWMRRKALAGLGAQTTCSPDAFLINCMNKRITTLLAP